MQLQCRQPHCTQPTVQHSKANEDMALVTNEISCSHTQFCITDGDIISLEFFQIRRLGPHNRTHTTCPSCCPVDSVRALKKIQSTDCEQEELPTCLILNLCTTTEGILQHSH